VQGAPQTIVELVFPYLATILLSLLAFLGVATFHRVSILEGELRGALSNLDRRVSRIEGRYSIKIGDEE
jgi:hypothetical protein